MCKVDAIVVLAWSFQLTRLIFWYFVIFICFSPYNMFQKLVDDYTLLTYIVLKIGHHEHNIDGFVQDCTNSIANALELRQSCTKLWIWCLMFRWITFQTYLLPWLADPYLAHSIVDSPHLKQGKWLIFSGPRPDWYHYDVTWYGSVWVVP